MKTNVDRAARLQQAATRMMIEGNVKRYLHALRLLFALGTAPRVMRRAIPLPTADGSRPHYGKNFRPAGSFSGRLR